jgi:hypothetical protein
MRSAALTSAWGSTDRSLFWLKRSMSRSIVLSWAVNRSNSERIILQSSSFGSRAIRRPTVSRFALSWWRARLNRASSSPAETVLRSFRKTHTFSERSKKPPISAVTGMGNSSVFRHTLQSRQAQRPRRKFSSTAAQIERFSRPPQGNAAARDVWYPGRPWRQIHLLLTTSFQLALVDLGFMRRIIDAVRLPRLHCGRRASRIPRAGRSRHRWDRGRGSRGHREDRGRDVHAVEDGQSEGGRGARP